MMGEERVMPTAQEDVEEKQEGVCACPMAMMNTAHAGSCCHLLWRCSEGREAPGDLETTWLHQVFASGQANVLKLLGSPCAPVFPPSSLRISPVSQRALIFPSQVLWGCGVCRAASLCALAGGHIWTRFREEQCGWCGGALMLFDSTD